MALPSWKKLFFILLIVVGIFGFLEATSTLYYFLFLPKQKLDILELAIGEKLSDHTILRYHPHPYFNFTNNPEFVFKNGHKAHNTLGLRGPICCLTGKEQGSVRIVALGGSTTYGMYFSNEKHVWPSLLEQHLRQDLGPTVQVINAGVPYYTTYEMLGMISMLVPEFSPDVIVIHTGLNDAFTVGFPDEGGPDNRFFRYAFTYRPLPNWMKGWMRASYFIRVIGAALGTKEGFLPGDMADLIQFSLPPEEDVVRHVKSATGKYFKRNLLTLVSLCRHLGAIPVIANMPINPAFETNQTTYYTAVAQAVIRNNHIARDIAIQSDALFVDLYSTMRAPEYFLDAGHVNKKGMQRKAATLAQAMLPLTRDLMHHTP